MKESLSKYCFRCANKFPHVYDTINKYKYCKSCVEKLFQLGISYKAIKAAQGKSNLIIKFLPLGPKIIDDYIQDEKDFHEKVDLVKLSKDLKYDLEEYLNKEQENIKSVLSNSCCICVTNKKDDDKKPIYAVILFYDFKLDQIFVPKFKFYKNHIICSSCLREFDKKKLGLNEEDDIDNIKRDIKVTCFCNICKMEHDTILKGESVKSNSNIKAQNVIVNGIVGKNKDAAKCCNIF